jgi:hypothetical protein
MVTHMYTTNRNIYYVYIFPTERVIGFIITFRINSYYLQATLHKLLLFAQTVEIDILKDAMG